MPLPSRFASLADTPLVENWDAAQSVRPDDFLAPDVLRDAAEWSGLTAEATEAFLVDAARIASDDDVAALAWTFYHGMFVDGRLRPRRAECPEVIPQLGALSGPFYLAVALWAVPPMRETHRSHGIPDTVSRNTASDIRVWIHEYTTRGIPTSHDFATPFDPMPVGLHVRGFAWCARSLYGDILRIERLQFIHAPFRPPFTVRRNRGSGDTVLFAEPGLLFDDEGWRLRDDADTVAFRSPDPANGSATRVADNGRAIPAPVEFDASDWETLLAPGDPILEIHIPEDGPMDFARCGAAFREAVAHYTAWYPDRPFKAFACGSWLLDPQFQDCMPDTSNVVRFQRAARLFPITRGPGRSGMLRIFTSDDIPNLPRDTTMRRGYLDHLAAGKGWWGGGCVVLPDELSRWD